MPYKKYVEASVYPGIHVCRYKDRNAFVEAGIHGGIKRIVLDDASHFFGESLSYVDYSQIEIYIEQESISPDETAINEKQRIIDQQWQTINKLLAEEDENKRGKKIAENILAEKQQRHNAQLRSIYYLLEQVENVGTHRDKAIVVDYIRRSIYSFLKADGLDKYGCPDDLPF